MEIFSQVAGIGFFLLLGGCGLFLVIQLYYLLGVYRKLAAYTVPQTPEKTANPPLSVIICARNEEENLRKNLPKILDQDYPEFEVILVNDFSEDDTKWLLKDWSQQYSHLKTVEIAEHVRLKHGKKFALTLGIKAARHEHLVFTDADCFPQSDQWLRQMAAAFSGGEEIVLGYSPYLKKRGFLNALIRFETFHTAMSYLSYALKGNPYMGVGRNIAYTKSLFFRGKGFAAHMHIPSGDDDLFVNQNATPHNTAICIHPDAHVWSEPKTAFAAYASQKTRHAGASKAYKPAHRRMLATQLISAILFYAVALITVVLYPSYWYMVLGAYLLRLLVQLVVYYPIMKKLQTQGLIWALPILDPVYYGYICINGFFALFKKDVTWK
ncbi:Glycosyltransferase, catalytic subunit of cellulose synthase and poly-beta-1,6-N-acetylglucosamine synthase [Parapedobacter composti]|uniref:Glycosyltransferase, catalytic subunit of cellulose synthase and poly-beta-1,6-N-acetylglucosamine synthase n=1 Tax=Parapedobacter composti TaxID=623281 RepID=A0A1I1HV30_9SPHI|nr:glycosyltransferase [Parapedobacter composti]SFC27422.1 Glycosyltransferase, catalytic subunit of cellulose synthase and poly-beta-1,6-N-acetylglucosamine synthase [Parapedobacter composti]